MAEETAPAPGGEALDLDAALRRDEKEDLRRRLGETAEQLEAAHAKECPSCGAAFKKGVGSVAKKKAEDGAEKKPAEKKAAEKPEEKPAEKPADDEDDDDEDGLTFFD